MTPAPQGLAELEAEFRRLQAGARRNAHRSDGEGSAWQSGYATAARKCADLLAAERERQRAIVEASDVAEVGE